MLKFATLSFLAAWAVFLLITLTGHVAWDNRLMWFPAVALMASTVTSLGSLEDAENRAALLLIGAASFGCLLLYSVFYIFVFAYSGY